MDHVSSESIDAFVRELVEQFSPRRVVLFGSYARGDQTVDSDVDILVVRDKCRHPLREAVEMRVALKPRFPLDLVVRSQAELQRRLRLRDTFLTEVLETGKVLHEA